MGPIEETIKRVVARNGWGPWYQREAWDYYSAELYKNLPTVFDRLNERYPDINA